MGTIRKIYEFSKVDATNITNLVYLIASIICLFYNSWYRVLMLRGLSSMDIRTIRALKDTQTNKLSPLGQLISSWIILIIIAYIYSISEMFFFEDDYLPTDYDINHCDTFFNCVGAALDNDIRIDGSLFILDLIGFIMILIYSTNILINLLISMFPFDDTQGSSQEICLICGK
jgi:hypothetical protein